MGGSVTVSAAISPADLRERDAAARLRALTDLDSTLLVEAGAGSGKTRVLSYRIAHIQRASPTRGRIRRGRAARQDTDTAPTRMAARTDAGTASGAVSGSRRA